MLPDFSFCSLFPVQQTTSGTGHRVNKVVFFGLATNTLNVRNNNNNNNAIGTVPSLSGHAIAYR